MGANRKHFFFDMDGTLTASRSEAEPSIITLLLKLAKKNDVIIVSGAAREQVKRQLPFLAGTRLYVLAESGNDANWGEVKLWRNLLEEDELQRIHDHIMKVLKFSESYDIMGLDQVEERGGQTSFSMIGHNAPRALKAAYDPDGKKRYQLLQRFPFREPGLAVRIGGTTCFDYSRAGWGKAGNIDMLLKTKQWDVADCMYVGDQLFPGGNDYEVLEVFTPERVYQVAVPEDTEQFIIDALSGVYS